MTPKKSGLADSPFFRPPSSPPPPSQIETQTAPTQEPPASIPVFTDAQAHEGTDTQPHGRTTEQTHEYTNTQTHVRADEHLHERTDAHLHKRTNAQPERRKSRESYDVYEDQVQAIEELALKWRKARGKHITKGQVMRELLDEILPAKR
jgi:hypothetical protein